MKQAIVLGIIELGKLFLSGYFQAMRMAGKTTEEIKLMVDEEYAEFEKNKPEDLPDV